MEEGREGGKPVKHEGLCHYTVCRRERGGLNCRVESKIWDGEKWMERETCDQDLVAQCSGVSRWVEGGAVPYKMEPRKKISRHIGWWF